MVWKYKFGKGKRIHEALKKTEFTFRSLLLVDEVSGTELYFFFFFLMNIRTRANKFECAWRKRSSDVKWSSGCDVDWGTYIWVESVYNVVLMHITSRHLPLSFSPSLCVQVERGPRRQDERIVPLPGDSGTGAAKGQLRRGLRIANQVFLDYHYRQTLILIPTRVPF